MLTRARLREKVKPTLRRMRSAAHGTRLSILYLLAHKPMMPKDLADDIGIPENLLSHHLKELYGGSWVTRTKQGREVTYQLKDKAFFEFFRLFEDTPAEKEVRSKHSKT